jgi:hypothetical protein
MIRRTVSCSCGQLLKLLRALGLCALAAIALTCPAATIVYAHRVAISFAPQSSELPEGSSAVLYSLVDEAASKCAEGAAVTVEVNEVVLLPLGKISSAPTTRTNKVAASLRELSKGTLVPYEASLSPQSDRARRLGLHQGDVGIELACPPRSGADPYQ